MKHFRWIAISVLLVFLAACGAGGGAPTLSISPSSTTVTAGGAPVNFSATLTGASGTINWSLTGPGSLSATSGTSTAYTPPASVASATSATLTATSGSLTATASITINPPPTITVAGKVVGINNQPVNGVPVVISGRPSVITAADGTFSVAGVTAPYDATVVNATTKQSIVYKGLTRSDPTLLFVGSTPGTSQSATLSGTISGGAFTPNQPADHTTKVVFASAEASGSDTLSGAVSGAYNLGTVSWFGPATTTGTIHALQWQRDAGGLPTDYKGYGTKTGVALSNGGAFPGQNVALTNVAEANLSGSVSVPTGYTLSGKVLSASFSPNANVQVLTDSTATNNFSYVTPNIGGATMLLAATATKPAVAQVISYKAGLAPNATGVSLNIPAAPELGLPANAATNITPSIDFSWSAFSGGVYLVYFNGPGSQPDYYVVTTATTTRIPDLSSLGLALPPATSYSWQIYAFAPFASVDAAAGPEGFLAGIVSVPSSDRSIALTNSRTFTTAP